MISISKLAIVFSVLILTWLFVPVSSERDYILAVSEVVPVNSDRTDTLPLNEVTPVNNNENDSQLIDEEDNGLSIEAVKPLKSYFLTLLPDGARQEIKINPPATRIAIISESGDTAVRCGDGFQNYSCIPGKRLELVYDRDTPIEKFWGENQSKNQVRLRIEVYQQIQSTDDTEEPNSSIEPS